MIKRMITFTLIVLVLGTFGLAHASESYCIVPPNPAGYIESRADSFFIKESTFSKPTKSSIIVVDVCCPCDEEWQAKSNWTTAASSAVENADDSLYEEFNIDLDVKVYRRWDSNDSYTSMNDLISEAKLEHGKGGYDMMIAFSDQGNFSGIAHVGTPYCLVFDNGSTNNKKICQHEVGHCYGCSHSNGHSAACIMNDTSAFYSYFDMWCSSHSTIMTNNYDLYGS